MPFYTNQGRPEITEEKKPSAGAALADRWLSKKLGIGGGAILALTQLGLDPDKAGLYIVIVACVYLVSQGYSEVQQRRADGMGTKEAILAELKETIGELKGAGNPPA